MLMFLLVLVKTERHHNAATLPKFLIRCTERRAVREYRKHKLDDGAVREHWQD